MGTINNNSSSSNAHHKSNSQFPAGSVQLLWAKTKVYIHPSKNKKENISGVLSLSKTENGSDKEIIVSWIPDFVVESRLDMEKFETCDMLCNGGSADTDESTDNNKSITLSKNKPIYIRKSVVTTMGSFAFSLEIQSIYSIQSRTPNLGLWWGSIIINSKSEYERLPVLFFHDDESESFKQRQRLNNKNFNPFSNYNGELFYGGDQFLDELGKHCHLEKSSLENCVYLVNPTSEDLKAFSPLNVKDATKKDGTYNVMNSFNFNKMLNDTKWTILESLAKISYMTKSNVSKAIEENKDIIPEPIKKLLEQPEIRRINDEFETANVYLAKWAMNVQEESLKNNSKYVLDDTYQNLLNSELGIESLDKLSPLELAQIQRRKPISKKEWDAMFDNQGRLCITVNEVKDRIFHGGLKNDDGVRKDAWMFLFGVYPWDSSNFERQQILQSLKEDYLDYVKKWKEDTTGEWDTEYWRDQKFRIEKDVNRNDRNIDLYKEEGDDNEGDNEATKKSKQATEDEEESADKIDFKNKHLRDLKEILLTYNTFNPNLGYVQGMCDLLSIVYYVFQDRAIAFWCFVKFMERMERNFLRDQSGIQKQMVTLNDLIALMLPKLYLHLEKADSTNLFFFFRMLLIWFKREFDFGEVIEIWDNFLTDFYSSQFHLFFALAILSKHEYIILEHLKTMEDILKYMNDLSLTMDKNDLLIRAELLFLRFKKLVEIVDRGALNEKLNKLRLDLINEQKKAAVNGRRRTGDVDKTALPMKYEITDNLRLLLSKDLVVEKETERDPAADTV